LQAGKNKEPEAGQRDDTGAAQEAVMPDLHEACGQDMLEEAPNELDDIEGELSHAVAVFLAVGESDGAIFDGHDSGVGDSHSEDIRCEVFQGCLTVADGLTVDVPGDVPDGGVYFIEQSLRCHRGFELCAIDWGQCSDRKIEGVAGRQPGFPVG